jgi:hypothetical protein
MTKEQGFVFVPTWKATVRKPLNPPRPQSPFRHVLRTMAKEDDGSFDRDGRKMLLQLAEEPETEEVWTQIVKSCGERGALFCRLFIREISSNRNIAKKSRHWPNYRKAARHAEALAEFLKGSGGLPPPVPMQQLWDRIEWLETTAVRLRERADLVRVRVSRQNVAGSRPRSLFIQLMSLSMHDMFGHWFDQGVARLTKVLFPSSQGTTADAVRKARQPLKPRMSR